MYYFKYDCIKIINTKIFLYNYEHFHFNIFLYARNKVKHNIFTNIKSNAKLR
jgi:hypothetical protein